MRSEINSVIKMMPAEKAPGPDGFNGVFLKRCWPLIKEDIYRMCEDFYEERINLASINTYFIVLVPKISSPLSVNDYRPISLLNCCVKILTKLLADRLQPHVLKIIHKNQYSFIKNRTIHDYLGWSFEYIHQCHQSRREIFIVKQDFAKAFNTVDHYTIIDMLQSLNFPSK